MVKQEAPGRKEAQEIVRSKQPHGHGIDYVVYASITTTKGRNPRIKITDAALVLMHAFTTWYNDDIAQWSL